ncbi:MAG: hypothetical protein LBS55_13705 [Prevotellaceae bacterium]|nr:hypothetical protein [Prevotellaceae bacterium]
MDNATYRTRQCRHAQRPEFPKGYKYDYCNPDALLHRLSVREGKLVTPAFHTFKI